MICEQWACPKCKSKKVEWYGEHTTACKDCGYYADDEKFIDVKVDLSDVT